MGLLTWTIVDNKLQNNGQTVTQFLILAVVLAIVWAILGAMFSYYFSRFKKLPAKEKIYGKASLLTTLSLGVVVLVAWILVLVFYTQPSAIFNTDASAAQGAIIAVTVIGFVALVAVMLMMWFFLPYYGIAFDDESIVFMGEAIPYHKITKIIKDTKTSNIYVNYTQGKRTHKKQKFRSTSVFGQFILANAALTGVEVTHEDELAYYKSLVQGQKVEQKPDDVVVDEKLKSKTTKTTSKNEENKEE